MSATVFDPEDLEAYEATENEANEAPSKLIPEADDIYNFLLEIIKEIANKSVEIYLSESNHLTGFKKSQKVEKPTKTTKKSNKINKKVKFSQMVTIISQKTSSDKEVSQAKVSKDLTSSDKRNAKTNLLKSFREAIESQKNLIEVSDSEEAAKKETGRFAIATMNAAGLRSKALTVNNIAKINQINAIIISETHYSSKAKPHLSGYYKVFHKNRDNFKACKGGIAIFLDPLHADNAVVIDSGQQNEEEFITVKLNNYVPPVALFACYGKKYLDLGLHLIVCGDLNAAVGLNGGL